MTESPIVYLSLSGRELVALHLFLQASEDDGSQDIMNIRESISRKLCEFLSIEQFEELETLYKRGYEFNELHIEQ